ncbi:hypothetical protein [Oligoflexus tunisiensis]|uniref:hypothetical protein n=1 Tax=Oligoflexus tunisiensis TaxID=708132 RepID=UPI00114CEAF1|nr:hypothetical protein [Oligoflexus tunisiensis]
MQLSIPNIFCKLLLGCMLPLAAAAQTAPTSFSPREHAWSIGTSTRHLNIKASHDFQVNAFAPYIDVGRGWVRPSWWSLVELSVMLGPNGERLPDSPPLDFIGTGFRFRAGHTMPGQVLRKPHGDWGVELGLEYNEWIARSYQDRLLSSGQNSGSWVVRSRWIFVQPALFYSFWKPPRPQGHKPEWIMTRNEGVVFSLGLSVPIQSEMQATFILGGEKLGLNDHWRGSLAFLSVTSWLGI